MEVSKKEVFFLCWSLVIVQRRNDNSSSSSSSSGAMPIPSLTIFFLFPFFDANPSSSSSFSKPQQQVVPAFGPDGTYADWDAVEALWDHALKDRLRLDASEHPFMLAEPTAQPDRDREEVVERVFEGRGPPALFLARDAVLSSFATGRATAMVVDAGHDSTTGEPCFFPCF